MRHNNAIPFTSLSDAALDEMVFWLGIMADHARFIRNGLDPTEETLFRRADRFAQRFDSLQASAASRELFNNYRELTYHTGEVLAATTELAEFKMFGAEQIRSCRLLAILPADLLDHIYTEAVYFMGKLRHIRMEPTPLRSELGLPNGDTMALSTPRLLIPSYPDQMHQIFYEETLFHLKIQMEHAEVLTLFYRPRVQHELVMETSRWADRLKCLYENVLTAYEINQDYRYLAADVESDLLPWRNFLAGLFSDLENCAVPTGQINLWPRVIDHMRREADYYLDTLALIRLNMPSLSS